MLDLHSPEEDGTQLTERIAPFPCHLIAQQHRTGWCFKAPSYFVPWLMQGAIRAGPLLLRMAMLIHFPCCTSWEICSCSWLPQAPAYANTSISFMSLFGQEVPKDRIYYSRYRLSFLFTHSIPFAKCSPYLLPPVFLLPGDLHVSCSSFQKTVTKSDGEDKVTKIVRMTRQVIPGCRDICFRCCRH